MSEGEHSPRPESKEPTRMTKVVIEQARPVFAKFPDSPNPDQLFFPASIHLHRNADGNEFGAPDDRRDINRFEDLSNINKLQIFIRDVGKPREIDLPEALLSRLAEYLRNLGDNSANFDCSRFVYFLNDLEYTFETQPVDEAWQRSKATTKPMRGHPDLEPGSVVAFIKDDEILHLGVYLTQDLILSQSGKGGKLMVISDYDTHQIYGTDQWAILTPRSSAPHWDGQPKEIV
jgi:hypothetical protein